MPKKTTKEFNFNDAYRELEEIVAWFERDELDLDEGLKKFERGLELAKLCEGRLDEVSRRVEEISAKFGALGAAPPAAAEEGSEEDEDEPQF
jgi:exodeoxyribonuclease VII small subunit